MLDRLEAIGALSWKWKYDQANSRAIFRVTVSAAPTRDLHTRDAEALVQQLCDEHGIVWEPVMHPGGKDQLLAAQRRIATRERQQGTKRRPT